MGRRTKVDYGFVGDTKTTLRALLPKLEQNQDDQHLMNSLDHYQKARHGLDNDSLAIVRMMGIGDLDMPT